jgi:hypothetical protein
LIRGEEAFGFYDTLKELSRANPAPGGLVQMIREHEPILDPTDWRSLRWFFKCPRSVSPSAPPA